MVVVLVFRGDGQVFGGYLVVEEEESLISFA